MRLSRLSLLGLLGSFLLFASLFAPEASAQTPTPTFIPGSQAPPPLPMLFAGTITANGQPVLDGLEIIARIGPGYESEPAVIQNGEYLVKVTPPNNTFSGRDITFEVAGVAAGQTAKFTPGALNLQFNLTLAEQPQPTLTPSPIPVLPAVYNGTIAIAGQPVPQDATLIARVGSYESFPANISGTNFTGLVIAPPDDDFARMPVRFFLNGVASTPPAHGVYEPGTTKSVNLVFIGVPMPAPTNTPVPPTETPVPPTNTPVPPTETPVPPTSTPTLVPPTATATTEPTPVVIQITATPTEAPPSPTPTPAPTGGCGSAGMPVPLGTAAANMLLFMAPLGIIGGIKYTRRRK